MVRTAIAALVLTAVTASAQAPIGGPTRFRTGPRFGVTWLSGKITEKIWTDYQIRVSPVISQFGWQFERQFAAVDGGPVALSEFALMVGGLDQGTAIPSVSWLVGIRTTGDFEVAVGPNATPAGVALAFSVGQTFHSGALSIPVNVAVVPSRYGVRSSILTGFNVYR